MFVLILRCICWLYSIERVRYYTADDGFESWWCWWAEQNNLSATPSSEKQTCESLTFALRSNSVKGTTGRRDQETWETHPNIPLPALDDLSTEPDQISVEHTPWSRADCIQWFVSLHVVMWHRLKVQSCNDNNMCRLLVKVSRAIKKVLVQIN